MYEIAERDHIEIYECDIARDGVSVRFPESCVIGLRSGLSTAHKNAVLAHELGHCETLSFYDEKSPFSRLQRCENRADKWAVRHCIPEDEFRRCVASGRAIWEIAEIFEVDEDLVMKAALLYYYNHL